MSTSIPDQKDIAIISSPLVFSCSGCKTIVGDSYSFICSNEVTKTITLSAASNVHRSAVVHTSKQGYDIGSTYFTFTCSNCPQTLGRYYITTSQDLDEIRTKFTFLCENLTTYELGKSTFGKVAEPEVLDFAADNLDTSLKRENIWSNTTYKTIQADILKMKHLISDHADRITMLEQKDNNSVTNNQPAIVRQSTVAQVTNVSWYGDGLPNTDPILHPDDRHKRYRIDTL